MLSACQQYFITGLLHGCGNALHTLVVAEISGYGKKNPCQAALLFDEMKEVISNKRAHRCWSWIEKTFENESKMEVRVLNYSERELPNTSESSREVSKVWANTFKEQFLDYSLLVSSEEYGNFVAEFMNIKHIVFDISETAFSNLCSQFPVIDT